MWRSSRLRFHRNHGGKCRWSKNAMEATCGGRGAVLFTEFPVPTGTAFEVESWSQDPSQPVVPLVIGLTTQCPDMMTKVPELLSDLYHDSPDQYWVWEKSTVSHSSSARKSSCNMMHVSVKEIPGILVDSAGYLHLLVDGKEKEVVYGKVPTDQPMWGVVEARKRIVQFKTEVLKIERNFTVVDDTQVLVPYHNIMLQEGALVKAFVTDAYEKLRSITRNNCWLWGSTKDTQGWFKSDAVMINEELLTQALKEGYIVATIIKVLCIGAPGVGKTCLKHLLLGLQPPERRSSTVARAITKIRITSDCADNGSIIWKEVDTQMLIDIVAQTIKFLPQQKRLHSTASTADGSFSGSNEEFTPQQREIRYPSIVVDTSSSEEVEVEEDLEGPDEAYMLTSTKDLLIRMEDSTSVRNPDETIDWVYYVDSGGQPQFMDILPVFNRGNTVNILVSNISEKLSHKPLFEFVKDGKHLRKPTHLTQTNLEIVEGLVRSLSSVNYCKINVAESSPAKPKFIIIGTHEDKLKKKELFTETLSGKNRLIQETMKDLDNVCIQYGPNGQIIFPINTLLTKNRDQVASDLREKIIKAQDVAIKVHIPTRWYIFELELSHWAKQRGRCVVSLKECLQIGRKLRMSTQEVKAALHFFHELTLYFYFPNLVPNLVFVDLQALLNELTELILMTIMDKPPVPHCVPMQAIAKFKKEGILEKRFIEVLCKKFRIKIGDECIYTIDHFLTIMEHLLIMAPLDETYYFLPCVLPTFPVSEEERKSFSTRLAPLLLVSDPKVIPQGMFPSLVVCLLSNKAPKMVLQSRQYRNAVKLRCSELGGAVLLVDHLSLLEVCYSGNPQRATKIVNTIKQAIQEVCHMLSYNNKEVLFKEGFWCSFAPRAHCCSPHPCFAVPLPSGGLELTCIKKAELSAESTDQRQVAWLSKDCTTDLFLPDLQNIVAARIPMKWKRFGLQLGLSPAQLDEVGDTHPLKSLECFSQVLIIWLQRRTRLPCSWSTVIEVLMSPAVGEEALANEIKEMHLF